MFEEKLRSKKNEVYKRERKLGGKTRFVVDKEFTDTKRFYIEHTIYRILANGGPPVPRLLDFQAPEGDFRGRLIYEFIEGDVALDMLAEDGAAEEAIRQIVNWMERFYKTTTEASGGGHWILGDIHLRNFIYVRNKGMVYGFDFEDAEKGIVERDVAKMLLYIATYEPAYSKRHMEIAEFFLRESLSTFEITKEWLIGEVFDESKRMAERRNHEVDAGIFVSMIERTF